MSIIVLVEHIEGKLKKQAAELVSFAAQQQSDSEIAVLAMGKVSREELEKLSRFGAGKIIHAGEIDQDVFDARLVTQLVAEVFSAENAQLLIMANSQLGKAIAPRLSVKLKAGLVAGVAELPDLQNDFLLKKKVFNGKAYAQVKVLSPGKILTLNSNACIVQDKPVECTYEVFAADGLSAAGGGQQLEKTKNTAAGMLTEASIVVSGGRGMRGAENWAPLEELAKSLNAATACSKPVSDEGWRSHNEHVGQTGKTIAPDLYIAIGISGAVQHLAGVSSSKTILAINTDKEAPIFEVADYGIIGDAQELLPRLIQSVKKLQDS